MEKLVFDNPEPKEIEVTIGSTDYVILEMSEDTHCRYTESQLKITKTVESPDGTKRTSFDGAAELDALLINLCLRELINGVGEKAGEKVKKPVEIGRIKGWKRSVTKAIATKIKEISGIQDADETEEGLVKKIKELQTKLISLRKNKVDLEEQVKNL